MKLLINKKYIIILINIKITINKNIFYFLFNNMKKNYKSKRKTHKRKLKRKYNIQKKYKGGMIVGSPMPQLCFGTAQNNISNFEKILTDAIQIGYNHIDGADVYGDIKYRTIIKHCLKTIERDNIWLTWKSNNITIENIKKTIEDLDFKYIDLFLIHHWDKKTMEENKLILDILIEAQKQGLIHHYGVSNCENIDDIRILRQEPYKIYANQIQARPPPLPQTDGQIKEQVLSRENWTSNFVNECNEVGVKVMLYGTISGFMNQTDFTMFEYENVKNINKYYIQKYINIQNQNVLIVASMSGNTLNTNFDDFNTIISGNELLSVDKMIEIEGQLKNLTLSNQS